MSSRLQSLLATGFVLVVVSFWSVTPLSGQDVYVVSWSLQDPSRGFEQELAAELLDSLNVWLTRDNPEAATVRLDDPLRITVKGTYDQSSGTITERIIRFDAGSLIIEDDARQFLSDRMVDSLLHRAYYWSDQKVDLIAGDLAPLHYALAEQNESDLASNGDHGSQMDLRVAELALDRAAVPLPDGLTRLVAGMGNETLNLPGLSYGRAYAGLERWGARLWYEMPASFGLADAIGSRNRGAHGFGVSYQGRHFGAQATFADPFDNPDSDDTLGLLSSSLVAYASLFGSNSSVSVLGGTVGVDVGAGYVESTQSGGGGAGVGIASQLDVRWFVRGRGQWRSRGHGIPTREVVVQSFGGSALLSWYEHLVGPLGMRLAVARHDIVLERAAYEPETTVWISPVLSFRFD